MTEKINKYNYLTIDEIESIVRFLSIRESRIENGEPLPPFDTRYPNKLESILYSIEAEYFGVEAYPDLVSKAARLFYGIVAEHPFMNGNKRTGVMILCSFILKNLHTIPNFHSIYFDKYILYEMSLKVAQSKHDEEETIMLYLIKNISNMILIKRSLIQIIIRPFITFKFS